MGEGMDEMRLNESTTPEYGLMCLSSMNNALFSCTWCVVLSPSSRGLSLFLSSDMRGDLSMTIPTHLGHCSMRFFCKSYFCVCQSVQ